MKTRSCKAKGKRLVQLVKSKLLECAPDLQDADIRVPTTSQPGSDLHLSPKAREKYPYVFEMKNVEKLNIHAAYDQAKSHITSDTMDCVFINQIPIVVFAKNRTEPLVCISLDHFLYLTT